MSKFFKRLQKSTKKSLENCIVLGIDQENFDFITESFNSVFLVDNTYPYTGAKNIIPLKDLYFFNNIGNVDVIFINQRYEDAVMQYIPMLTRRSAPVILFNPVYELSTEYIKMFQRIRYEMIEVVNDYQLWKIIRK